MKTTRKLARQRLKDASKAEFEKIVDDAKLTPIQEKIVRLHFVKDWSICKIALSLSCCDSVVKKHLTITYDRINKL